MGVIDHEISNRTLVLLVSAFVSVIDRRWKNIGREDYDFDRKPETARTEYPF